MAEAGERENGCASAEVGERQARQKRPSTMRHRSGLAAREVMAVEIVVAREPGTMTALGGFLDLIVGLHGWTEHRAFLFGLHDVVYTWSGDLACCGWQTGRRLCVRNTGLEADYILEGGNNGT